MGSGGGTDTRSSPTIPPQLQAVTQGAANTIQGMQGQAGAFLMNPGSYQPLQVAGLTPIEQQMQGLLPGGIQSMTSMPSGLQMSVDLLQMDPNNPQGWMALAAKQTPETGAQQALEQMYPGWTQQAGQTVALPYQQQIANLYSQAVGGPAMQGVGMQGSEAQALAAYSQAMQQALANQVGTPGAEPQALNVINSLTSGPLGASPATQEAIGFLENQYQTRALPSMENALATAGLGHSGALEQGVADLRGQMMGAEASLLNQEMQARQAAGQELANIGQAQTGRAEANIQQGIQGLLSGGGALQSLGGQVAGRTEQDLARQLQGLLSGGGAMQSLGGQAAGLSEQDIARLNQWNLASMQMAPTQEQFQWQQANTPIDRSLATMQGLLQPLQAIDQSQLNTWQAIGQMATQPRQLQQQQNLANLQNTLREQALAEEATFGIAGGMFPSAIGQTVTQRATGGGFLGLGK